jgi:GT2 family glycosyltransferase
MALIAIAIFDTIENKRTELTRLTLECLSFTVNPARHRVFLIDNASCESTKELLRAYSREYTVITNDTNIGTAEAINLAWRLRRPGEHAVKMDNDVIIHRDGWPDELEEALERDPLLGIVGLKRKDCIEHPQRTDWYKSELFHLPHNPGERWIVAEKVNHVMGTCQMYSDTLLQRIGYLYQPRLYGFDDALAAARCQVAGFYSAFLPHIEIDHIDPGDTPYQGWKEAHAGEDMAEYSRIVNEYFTGKRSIHYNPFK